MFWVLFARDNVYKPQSEARSAVTAAKIDQWHKSPGLNLLFLLGLKRAVMHTFFFGFQSLFIEPFRKSQ